MWTPPRAARNEYIVETRYGARTVTAVTVQGAARITKRFPGIVALQGHLRRCHRHPRSLALAASIAVAARQGRTSTARNR